MNYQGDYCDIFSFDETENEVGLAILDSIYEPGDTFREYNKVGRTIDVLDRDDDITTSHGLQVANIASYYCNDPTYHFCRFVQNGEKYRDRDLMQAVAKVSDYDEIDILNISAGSPHLSDPDQSCSSAGPDCPLCEVVESAVDSGLVVVAAAGNEETRGVQCPSLSEAVISVGGIASHCTADISEENPILRPSSPIRPPNAYWVERNDGNSAEGTYCTNRGCLPGESCSENRIEQPMWDDDSYTSKKPDTLAPYLFPTRIDDKPAILAGTSYATPIVTAGIVNTFYGLYRKGIEPTSNQVRTAINQSNREISQSEKGVFCHKSFSKTVGDRFGLDLDMGGKTDDSDLYDTIG